GGRNYVGDGGGISSAAEAPPPCKSDVALSLDSQKTTCWTGWSKQRHGIAHAISKRGVPGVQRQEIDSNGVLEHQDSRSGGISRGRSCRSINAAAQTSATFLRSARPTQLSDIASQAFLDHLLPGLGRVLINVGIGRKSALGANRTQSVCRQCTCIEYGLGRCRGQALCRRARSARSAAFTDLWRFQWLSASDIDLRYARPVSEQHCPDP